jgi:hypothetical protein
MLLRAKALDWRAIDPLCVPCDDFVPSQWLNPPVKFSLPYFVIVQKKGPFHLWKIFTR